jgi:hypothetical protein
MTQNRLNLPSHLRQKVDAELEPGEKIRWIEQPVPQFWNPVTIGSVLFGIPWLSFSLFWMWGAMGFKLPDFREGFPTESLPLLFFSLFGLPFVLVGVGMLSAPLWLWQQTRNTVYVITDRRALSFQGKKTVTIQSFLPQNMENIFRRERAKGLGDVVLNVRHWKDDDGDQRSEEKGFLNIRNPQAVERLIQQVVQEEAE